MRLLVLGGTIFLGRHVAQLALDAGHDVTLFHRGRTNPGVFPRATHLIGDRSRDVSALDTGATYDVVVDTSGFVPEDVLRSARALEGRVGRYVFVSSASAYVDWPRVPGLDEDSPVYATVPGEDAPAERYGALKAACERVVRELLGEDGSLIVRAGLIVGPHENVGRLPAWIERAERGAPLLVPAPPSRPLQLLDARDLAAWMLEDGRTGTFNAVGPDLTMADLVDALGVEEPVYAPDDVLSDAGLETWVDLAFWTPEAEDPGVLRVDGRRSGIVTRPLSETVRDTRRWLLEEGGREALAAARPARGGARVLDADREAEIVARVRGS
jgi:2'-hydroxyisoflavone reductase